MERKGDLEPAPTEDQRKWRKWGQDRPKEDESSESTRQKQDGQFQQGRKLETKRRAGGMGIG